MRDFEPSLSERLSAQAEAKRALLARLKPKATVQAGEIIPWDAREAARIRSLMERPKPPKPPTVEEVCIWVAEEVVEAPVPAVHVEPVRYRADAPTPEFVATFAPVAWPTQRGKTRQKRWRTYQWQCGNRTCYYCGVELVLPPKKQPSPFTPPLNMATVDHRQPFALDGEDHHSNYAMCCWRDNNRKGSMTEAEYVAILEAERLADWTTHQAVLA